MAYSCLRCKIPIEEGEPVVYANGQSYHSDCFICCYCFAPFSESQYFEVNGQLFCFEDYKRLYAPICSECGEGIVGKVVRALNSNWHVDCFKCFYCKTKLQSAGGCTFHQNKICCKECQANYIGTSYVCATCKTHIPPHKEIFYRQAPIHPWHFTCSSCGAELSEETEDMGGKLYCKRCFNLNHAMVCDFCKKVIKGERGICAANRVFHAHHFFCTTCGEGLTGRPHYENERLPYCDTHFKEFFGKVCCLCKLGIVDQETIMYGRVHCPNHAVCYMCLASVEEKTLTQIDGRPVCQPCFHRLPIKVKKNLKDNKN